MFSGQKPTLTIRKTITSSPYALSYCYITSRRSNCNKTNYTSYGCTHCRRFAATKTVKEYPCHHSCCTSCICIQESFYCSTICMKRTSGIESKPSEPKQCCTK